MIIWNLQFLKESWVKQKTGNEIDKKIIKPVKERMKKVNKYIYWTRVIIIELAMHPLNISRHNKTAVEFSRPPTVNLIRLKFFKTDTNATQTEEREREREEKRGRGLK